MWMQKNLFGKALKTPAPASKKEINKVCCEPCYTAKNRKCTCKCHGAYHGLGKVNSRDPNDKVLPENIAQRFRKYFEKDARCHCGHSLLNEPIMYYVPHSGGWTVDCEKEKAWLFIHCPICGYDMSIWKIGVPREPED